jgi:hypothetical protein
MLAHFLTEPWRPWTKDSALKFATPSPRAWGEGEGEGQAHKDMRI